LETVRHTHPVQNCLASSLTSTAIDATCQSFWWAERHLSSSDEMNASHKLFIALNRKHARNLPVAQDELLLSPWNFSQSHQSSHAVAVDLLSNPEVDTPIQIESLWTAMKFC
jgi:hypothetical protein